MEQKIKVTFSDGSRRVLKMPDEIQNIDKNREARFVMFNGNVYRGYSDGVIDAYGMIRIGKTPSVPGIGLPFRGLCGWCYVSTDRKRAKQ